MENATAHVMEESKYRQKTPLHSCGLDYGIGSLQPVFACIPREFCGKIIDWFYLNAIAIQTIKGTS